MKHIMQHDTMQCGVACIEMICKYYRKKYYFNSLSYFTQQQKASHYLH